MRWEYRALPELISCYRVSPKLLIAHSSHIQARQQVPRSWMLRAPRKAHRRGVAIAGESQVVARLRKLTDVTLRMALPPRPRRPNDCPQIRHDRLPTEHSSDPGSVGDQSRGIARARPFYSRADLALSYL